jgi:hypothetical protein
MKKPPRKAIAKKAVAKKRNSGNIFVMPDGSTIGGRDIGKIKPTPKPKPMPSPSQWTPKQYDAILKKAIADAKKKKKY